MVKQTPKETVTESLMIKEKLSIETSRDGCVSRLK